MVHCVLSCSHTSLELCPHQGFSTWLFLGVADKKAAEELPEMLAKIRSGEFDNNFFDGDCLVKTPTNEKLRWPSHYCHVMLTVYEISTNLPYEDVEPSWWGALLVNSQH